MALEVVMMTLGIAQTNCYILGDTETKAAVVIDPSDNAAAIMQQITDRGWQVKQILATHAHFDHVLAVDGVRQATGAPFRLHEADLPTLAWMQASGQRFGLEIPPPPEVDSYVEAGETITVDGIQLEVLFTPGHALGHVSYVLASDSMVFSGDCLFRGSIGRYRREKRPGTGGGHARGPRPVAPHGRSARAQRGRLGRCGHPRRGGICRSAGGRPRLRSGGRAGPRFPG